jgi:hypothetical protein
MVKVKVQNNRNLLLLREHFHTGSLTRGKIIIKKGFSQKLVTILAKAEYTSIYHIPDINVGATLNTLNIT